MASERYKVQQFWTREDILKLLIADLNARGLDVEGRIQFVLNYRELAGARQIKEIEADG